MNGLTGRAVSVGKLSWALSQIGRTLKIVNHLNQMEVETQSRARELFCKLLAQESTEYLDLNATVPTLYSHLRFFIGNPRRPYGRVQFIQVTNAGSISKPLI